ncbi:MAG: glucose PTS transporter subunit IIA [Firmicutes bacterium]|nr:glucose PTS transporter subunit IIA [Bacillota bacterium]
MSRAFFQKLAATLMVPIVLLPVAAVLQAVGFLTGLGWLTAGGQAVVFHFLPLFFALAVPVGFAGGDGMAAIAAGTGYVVMTGVAAAVAGEAQLNPGVLGGLLAGGVATWLFHRCHRVQLPEFLGLFSGKRLVPTLAALAGVPLGLAYGAVWPQVVGAVTRLGHWVAAAGPLGAFAYGALDRLLLPTGLHHILNNVVEYQLGSYVDPATGTTVMGEIARFYAGDPTAGKLMSGFFVFNNFAIPAIALAIAHSARPAHRRRVTGLMVTGLLTSVLTGITEPVEFAFIFAAPGLWAIHILLTGLAQALTYALGVRLWGYAAPMFLINYPLATRPWWIVAIGVPYFFLYYALFRFAIRRFRLPVLGQEPGEDGPAPAGGLAPAVGVIPTAGLAPAGELAPAAAAPAPGAGEAGAGGARPGRGPVTPDLAAAVLQALGGRENLRSLEACMSRLRVTVADPDRVDDRALMRLGAAGVVRLGGGALQVVVGGRAEMLRAEMERLLRGEAAGALGEAAGAPRSATPPASGPREPGPGTAREVVLVAPVTGTVVPLEEVPDPVFAQGLVGEGVAVQPAGELVVAPCAGTVAHLFPGGHGVGLVSPEGVEVLLHVGIDTVQLRGQGFTPLVREGDRVRAGDPLVRFDRAVLRAAGKEAVTPVLVTNREQAERIEPLAWGPVTAGVTPLLRVVLRDQGRPAAPEARDRS